MQEILEILSYPWAIRALITASIVGITCGLIGTFIVLKNMSLIGDALSHSILPGIYFSFILVGYSTVGFFLGSVIAGLITAVAITWLQTNVKTKNDAAIGIVFTAMFAIGVVGISSLNNQEGNHLDLEDFLFGNLLGINNQDIVLSVIVLVFTALAIYIFFRHFFITTFQPVIAETFGISNKTMHYFLMLMLSFAVVSALQSVGVILVVAMLITPSATALLLSHHLKNVVILSAFIGLVTSIIGIIMAIIYNLPPGPAIVIVATIIYGGAILFSPQKGLIQRWIKIRKQKRRILQEDIIKLLSKKPNTGIQHIATELNHRTSVIRSSLQLLKTEGVLTNDLKPTLSIKGIQIANQLVRAHRLWESYQADKLGLNETQLHPDAERMEHHLSSEILDQIDSKLGFPQKDPHGSPIPQKKISAPNPLLQLRPKVKAKISQNQINNWVESELWELELLPNTIISIQNVLEDKIIIRTNNKEVQLSAELARLINVE